MMRIAIVEHLKPQLIDSLSNKFILSNEYIKYLLNRIKLYKKEVYLYASFFFKLNLKNDKQDFPNYSFYLTNAFYSKHKAERINFT